MSRAFTYKYGGFLGAGYDLGCACHSFGIGSHGGVHIHRCVIKFFHFGTIHDFGEGGSGHVDIHTAGTAAHRCTVGTGNCAWYILGVAATERGFHVWTCRVKLVELFVGTHVHIHHCGVAGTRNLNHRIAVDCGVDRSGKTVEEAERRNGKKHTRLAGKESVCGGGHTCLLFKSEPVIIHAHFLHGIGYFRNRNTHKTVHIHKAETAQRLGKYIHTRYLSRKLGLVGIRGRCCCCTHIIYSLKVKKPSRRNVARLGGLPHSLRHGIYIIRN